MENSTSDVNLINQAPLQIRKRKTFLIDSQPKIAVRDKNRKNSKSFSSFVSINQRRMSFKLRNKNSLYLSVKDFKDIEEDIKFAILDMRRNCLWELRRQSNFISNIFEEDKSKREGPDNNSQVMGKYAIKYLEDLNNNEKNLIKMKRAKTFNFKSNKKIKELDHSKNENKIESKIPKKYVSSNAVFKIRMDKKKFNPKEKFRILSHGGQIIDSHNESESDEEPESNGILINPETKLIFAYDGIITLATLFSCIYMPIEIAKFFCYCPSNNNLFKIIINLIFDILFIFDLIIGFFREYFTKEEEKLVKNHFKIIKNYISGWFFMDLITSIPFNIYFYFICKKQENKICYSYEEYNKLLYYLVLARCLKSIKIFKITTRKKNQFITEVVEKCSDISILGKFFDMFSKILFILGGLHLISCLNIYIGKHIYPGWLFKNEFQNYSFLKLYIISIYYLITTMTTVGYGEIQSDSLKEIIFRIVLLAVGILIYSWLISSISNEINKQSYASINYSNECLILENIRISHRKLP